MDKHSAIEAPQSEFAPIAVSINTDDIQALFACNTSPYQFNQLILAKLKDAGAPVEGVLNLKLAHGALCKVRDNPLKPQEEFVYMWLPAEYAQAIKDGHTGRA